MLKYADSSTERKVYDGSTEALVRERKNGEILTVDTQGGQHEQEAICQREQCEEGRK